MLHLHRLERHERLTGFHGLADRNVDGQDGARHRSEHVGRAKRTDRLVCDRGPSGSVHIRWTRQAKGHAPAVDVEMDDASDSDEAWWRTIAPSRNDDRAFDAVGFETNGASPVDAPATGPWADVLVELRECRGGRAPALAGNRYPFAPIVGRPDPIQGVGSRAAIEDDRFADQPAEEPEVGHDTQDDGLVECGRQAGEGRRPVWAPGDDLAEHGIEASPDLAADLDSRIDADACTSRPAKGLDAPGGRQETVLRILGI